MEELLRFAHSWLRWVVVIVAVVAFIYMLMGVLQSRGYDKAARRVMTIFSSIIGLQWLVGLIFLVVLGSQTGFGLRHYWEHLFSQTVALAVAHVHLRWKNATTPQPYRNNLIVIIVVAVLIVVGILALPTGIQWRFYGV